MVQRAAPLKNGSGGPSHVESDHFCHMLSSKKFKGQAKSLREQIALLVRTLASTFVDHHLIDSFTTCRLIPLIEKPWGKTYRHR